jgi:hypothetical protein
MATPYTTCHKNPMHQFKLQRIAADRICRGWFCEVVLLVFRFEPDSEQQTKHSDQEWHESVKIRLDPVNQQSLAAIIG